jgi:3-methyladenine DNA glycosylase/8-oxoguanine DNA glycosylase
MFCMGRFDVLPVGDLEIRNGIQELYELKERPRALGSFIYRVASFAQGSLQSLAKDC